MKRCLCCGADLSSDETGLHKKLWGKYSTEFLCINCNAEKFNVSVELLSGKIQEWRDMGCTLFVK